MKLNKFNNRIEIIMIIKMKMIYIYLKIIVQTNKKKSKRVISQF